MAAADPTAFDLPTGGLLGDGSRRAEWRQHRIRTRTWSLTPIQEFTQADLRRWQNIWQAAFEAAQLSMVRDAATKHIHSIDGQLTRFRSGTPRSRPSPDRR